MTFTGVAKKSLKHDGNSVMMLFGCRSVFSSFSFDRIIVINYSSLCIFRRYHGHHHKRTSSRFKWPHQGFMPSRTPYQMFPAISTADEAAGFVSYLTKNERFLLLSQLQKFPTEQDFDGLYFALLNNSIGDRFTSDRQTGSGPSCCDLPPNCW